MLVTPSALRSLALVALVAVASGCASSKPPPTAQLAESRTVIAQAEQTGADRYAPLELRKAKQKLDEAERLASKGDYDSARRMAEQAAVDAELAETLAQSQKAQAAVQEIRATIEALRQEIRRNTAQ